MSAPLVYATPKAARRAARLLPGVVLERAVSAAIVQGDLCAGHRGGVVFLGPVVAQVERRPGRLRDRPRQWLVVDLEPQDFHQRRGAGKASSRPVPTREEDSNGDR